MDVAEAISIMSNWGFGVTLRTLEMHQGGGQWLPVRRSAYEKRTQELELAMKLFVEFRGRVLGSNEIKADVIAKRAIKDAADFFKEWGGLL